MDKNKKKDFHISNIYLTGFMGTGKTVIGRELARWTERKFIDTDNLIERMKKKPVADIFKQYGEEGFRRCEREALLYLLSEHRPGSLVVSTGGGIMLDPVNREKIEESGLIILLTASKTAILRRIKKEDTLRPLLALSDPGQKIEDLLDKRKEIYSIYDFKIDTTGVSVNRVVRAIIKYLNSL